MDLSIVIPAWNESGKIAHDLQAAGEFLQQADLSGEVLVVDDGSDDGTTQAVEALTFPAGIELRVITLPVHRGKGYALRMGMATSRGELVMFADSGSCIPFSCAHAGLELIKSGACELAHGSRKLPETVINRGQSRFRRLGSTLLMGLLHRLAGIGGEYTDTQCGFKLYRGELARELYGRCRTDGFMFDLEVILLARRRGCRIREFPVTWSCDPDSRLSTWAAPLVCIGEVLRIRRNLAGVNFGGSDPIG